MKENYGRANAKALKKLRKILQLVNDREAVYAAMSDDELAGQTPVLREKYKAGASLDELLPDAYAVCREAARRTLGQRHFDVQVMGGIALHQGRICQMATGEGKTLTETLPAYLNALTGEGVHIVTVNEYLAKRDMEWMGHVFKFLGLTVGVTLSQQPFEEKKAAYLCDVTYGTNSEFGFDYLRDNMATARVQRVQRGLSFVIVDEVDSILIDEARTPLIISGRGDKPGGEYARAKDFVMRLQKSTNVDVEGNTDGEGDRFARFVKSKDEEEAPNGDYVVDEKNNSVRLTARGVKKAELYYKVDNLSSPENSEINHFINNALRAQALMNRGVDYIVEKGRVVIVDNFTGRKMEGRRFSNGLHQAIEAKENVTIQPEDKTVATITLQNYFRLYRKMSGMTGTAKTEEREFNTIYNVDVVVIPTNKPVIRIDHDDQFFRTNEGKMKAVVNKIRECHEHGQPVLVGTTSVEKSIALSRRLRESGITDKQVVTLLNAKSDEEKEALAIAKAGMPGAITIATNMAGRGTDILLGGGDPLPLAREEFRRLMKQRYRQTEKDPAAVEQKVRDALELAMSDEAGDAFAEECRKIYREIYDRYAEEFKQNRQKVLDAGGLFVIGTERHEARRIDDQLRGRAGRQGDPGESMFFVSAEDDMIRLFGDTLQRTLAFLKMDDDTPIQMRMITKGVEMAQKRIEGMHFTARKTVLQYDDVNNQQRKVIYKERDRIMDNEDIHSDILAMVPDYARYALAEACGSDENVDNWDLDNVNKVLRGFFVCDPDTDLVTKDDLTSARDVCDKLAEYLKNFFNERLAEAGENGASFYHRLERDMLLRSMDSLWMDHIDALDELRKGVGLQAIGQHDPLAVYKKEAYEMFEELNEQIKVQALRRLMRYRVTASAKSEDPADNINAEKKLNGPCPCGSGKKYKNCCYQKDLQKQRENSQDDEQEQRPLTKQEIYALKRQQRKSEKELQKITDIKNNRKQ